VPYDIETALKLFPIQPDEARARAPLVRALYGGISESTMWSYIKAGKIPKPIELGLFRVGDLRKSLGAKAAA